MCVCIIGNITASEYELEECKKRIVELEQGIFKDTPTMRDSEVLWLNVRITELEAEIEKHKQLWVDDVDRLQDRIAIQRGIVENHVIQERVLSEEIATLKESQRWIPVSDRLPDAVDKNAGSYQTREIAYRHIGSPIYYQFISYGYLRTDGWVRCRILDEKLDQELYEVTYWKERTYPKESAE